MSLNNISCAEARQLLRTGAVLLDVRQPNEFQAGALPDAVNVPLHSIPSAIEQFNRGTPLILYCSTGRRSAHARMIIQSMGIDGVYDLGSFRNYFNCD